MTTRAPRSFGQREPFGLGTAIGFGMLLAAAGATEATRPANPTSPRAWTVMTGDWGRAARGAIEAPTGDAPAQSASASGEPPVIDLPPDAKSAGAAHPVPSGRPHRPKFLNSRE